MNFDPSAFREESRGTWRGVAAGWEDRREWLMRTTAAVNDWLLAKSDPQPGETVLELAAGTGDLGFEAARAIGPDGTLISTDFAPEMVEVARRVGTAAGLTDVDHRVMDAEHLELDDDSVDAVLCRWAFMLMADPAAAFNEAGRVLRPAGRLAFAVWTTADRNPWALVPASVLIQRGHMPPPDPNRPGIFAFGEPDRFIGILTSAGFVEPEVEEIHFSFVHPNFEDAWMTTRKLTGPLADVLENLSDEEIQATRDSVEQAMTEFRQEDGSYTIPASTWGVTTRTA